MAIIIELLKFGGIVSIILIVFSAIVLMSESSIETNDTDENDEGTSPDTSDLIGLKYGLNQANIVTLVIMGIFIYILLGVLI